MSRIGPVLTACFVAERTRWALWLPVCLGIGVGGYFSLPNEPGIFTGPLATLMTALAGWALRRHGGVIFVVMVALTTMCAGFSIAQLRTAAVDAPILAKRIGPTMVEGPCVACSTSHKRLSSGPRTIGD